MFFRKFFPALVILIISVQRGWAASGTEGASFLDIPVGAGPAALGSAYSAQATDVYATVWNPAGLGYLNTLEFTGTHLDYLSPVYYEHAGIVIPLGTKGDSSTSPAGLGASVQYLGTSGIDARDDTGASLGTFTSAFAAYSLAYGQKIVDGLSLGITGKLITESISDATAKAYATDMGLLYKPTSKLNVAAVVANLGSGLKFVNESDPLPRQERLGATYQMHPNLDISAEGVYRQTGLVSGSLGVEWRSGDMFSIRGGYNTDHTKDLGLASGITAGIGLFFWGQEFSYAFVPLGDLGYTHYFSIVFRTSKQARPERPRLQTPREEDFDDSKNEFKSDDTESYHNIFDILNDDERKAAQ
jgi:hypothetical protein